MKGVKWSDRMMDLSWQGKICRFFERKSQRPCGCNDLANPASLNVGFANPQQKYATTVGNLRVKTSQHNIINITPGSFKSSHHGFSGKLPTKWKEASIGDIPCSTEPWLWESRLPSHDGSMGRFYFYMIYLFAIKINVHLPDEGIYTSIWLNLA